MITYMMLIILFMLLSSLATLNTLKTLMILTDFMAPKAFYPLIKMISTSDRITMLPSMKFILSFEYFFIPKDVNFNVISIAKIIVNTRLAESRMLDNQSGIP